jgi:hypothetical protein
MNAAKDDGPGVAFAQLTGAYWLDDPGGDCLWCGALLGMRSEQRHSSTGAGHGIADRLVRLRVVIVPVAALTVVAAVVVGVLA